MRQRRKAYTLVEMMIVVIILGIVAMVVIPQWSSASTSSMESRVDCDIQTVRKQILLYQAQHNGQSPYVNSSGSADPSNFIARLTSTTDSLGNVGGGNLGPYLTEWPTNCFASSSSIAGVINYGAASPPARDGSSGWYFSTSSCIFSANTKTGGVSLDPAAQSAGPMAHP